MRKISAAEKRFRAQLTASLQDGDSMVAIGETVFPVVDILQRDSAAYDEEFRRWQDDDLRAKQVETLERILSDRSSRDRLEELSTRLASDRFVLFIGSGVSAAFGCPMWTQFLEGLRAKANGITKTALKKLMAQDYEVAAQTLLETMTDGLFQEQIQHRFRHKPADCSTSAEWLSDLAGSLVVTTNYDRVLESVFEENQQGFFHHLYGDQIQYLRQRRSDGKRCLVKIHGDIRSRHTFVLTKDQYDRFYQTDSQSRIELEQIFRNDTILFVGCSLVTDRTLKVLEEIYRGDNGIPKHFALLRKPTPKKLRERELELSGKGIYPIWYDGGHDESLEALLGTLAMRKDETRA